MEVVRGAWTDERLDDFRVETARRFEALERRMDNGFNRVDARFDRLEARFDALQRTLLQVGGGLIATLAAGFFGVAITQL